MNKGIYLFLILLASCGSASRDGVVANLINYTTRYELTDKAGTFTVVREVGLKKSKSDYIVKKQVLSSDGDSKVLEQSIVISTPGSLKGKVSILRPKISQYMVWFDKKKYFTELKMDLKTKSMIVRMKSPESQWSGTKRVPFPKGTGAYCFFTHLIECAHATGFLDKAIEKKSGAMNLHVIWDGYPYVQEQYLNIPDTLFSQAQLKYDGTSKDGLRRFSLSVAGQNIFYFVNSSGALRKLFWISQGVSMVATQ